MSSNNNKLISFKFLHFPDSSVQHMYVSDDKRNGVPNLFVFTKSLFGSFSTV